jgi:membrane-associated protein
VTPLLAAAGILDPEAILRRGGLLALLLVVFAESGLLIGFFLPGDSLLFVAGFLASPAGGEFLPGLGVLLPLLFVAAVGGDQVGYLFGRRVGPALFRRPDSRLFKREHLLRAETFYQKHGPKTIVLARFVPIVRTFAPILAGVGSMHYRTFVAYNLLGGGLWAGGVTTLGFWLGRLPIVRDNIEVALIVIVAVSVLPMAREFGKAWWAARNGRPEPADPASESVLG